MGNHLHTSLKITTVNIEGVIANKLFLEQLCAQNDILCLQEHWLWDFQKQWLQNNFSGFKSFARCHDSNDPITNYNIPRGQSGVAILWSNKLSDKVTCLDVGNERIVAIQLEVGFKICLINVYLPTNKSDSEYYYRECLDVLHDIIRRFESTHKILLCGDLNGTLLPTRNNKHDVILKDFVKEHSLSTGSFDCVEPTFFHFNGVVTSQIDYILTSDPDFKAVVAGPAGRRAPDHFFGRVCFPPCPFFLVLAHFSLRLPLIFNLLMQSSITLVARVIHRPTKV